ncbi:MAG TPA: 23S rRNA (guanosine(2251)-2'-O)-methyltransferase RlmB [Phototrophicaceae bacterium]|nr:23S rRNA (guanosine(2251)-2'-O)-methyltransferase RlmB [Phototrophicaceae bacterium]
MADFVYGHWAVMETLRAGRRNLEQLLLAENVEERGVVAQIVKTAQERGIKIQRMPRRIMDDMADGANHQSTILRVGPYPYVDIEDALALADQRGEKPFLLILDLLKDPQNVGALVRVCEAVGVHGIILQERRGVDVTPAVANASSGAVEHMNVIQVTNLVNAMKELKEQDTWIVGLEAGPDIQPIDSTKLDMALGLVLGSEGEGMRRLVRDTCDLLLTLPMRGNVASLNVATAGSVALYAVWQARGWNGWKRA